MEIRSAARAVLLTEENRILMYRAEEPVTRKQIWVTPGGGIEEAETPEQAVRRELMEETGSRIDRFEPVGAYRITGDETTFRMICWAEVTRTQVPTEPDTGPTSIVEVRRIRPDEAPAVFSRRTAHLGSIYTLIHAVYSHVSGAADA